MAVTGHDPTSVRGPELTALQAVLIFAGAPAAIVAVIAALVFASNPRPGPPRTSPPVGIAVEPVACAVRHTGDGREDHDPAAPCWTMRCAECGVRYTEGANVVHFTGPLQAISVSAAHSWRLAGARMRCPRCA